MGLVQQAVLDFDEEIQVPWRPRLVAVSGEGGAPPEEWSRRARSSGRSSSRVGVCRPEGTVGAVAGAPARPPLEQPRRSREAPSGRPSPRRRVRLTRRARLLATVLVLALGVAIGSWLGPLLAGGNSDLRLAGVESVVVKPGDTLWSIARGVAGSADVRDVVARIQDVNHLRGTVLVPGQVLELP